MDDMHEILRAIKKIFPGRTIFIDRSVADCAHVEGVKVQFSVCIHQVQSAKFEYVCVIGKAPTLVDAAQAAIAEVWKEEGRV